MVCAQLEKLDDNLKESLHKPNLHEDSLHAPVEAGNLKKVLTPTCHEDGFHAPMEADNLKDGLHEPTFLEVGLQAAAKFKQFQDGFHKTTFGRTAYMHQRRPGISAWSSQAHLQRGWLTRTSGGRQLKKVSQAHLHVNG